MITTSSIISNLITWIYSDRINIQIPHKKSETFAENFRDTKLSSLPKSQRIIN